LDFLVSIFADDFCDAKVVVYCLCCGDNAYVAYLAVAGLVCCCVVWVFVVDFVIVFVWY
jgi:hypothetical protein